MCIDIREDYKKPYNKSRIRYKNVKIDEKDRITSQIADSFVWKPFKRNKAVDRINRDYNLVKQCQLDIGFHCFVNKIDARRECYLSNHLIAKIEVDKFIASGYNGGNECETWGYAKLIGLETIGGHRNIIKRFIKK